MNHLLACTPTHARAVRRAKAVSGLLACLVCLWGPVSSGAAPAQAGLHYPAGALQVPQPAALCVDSQGEVYVADAFGSRVIIYDHRGNFEFEFSTEGRLSGLRQVAVDKEGRIFVLGDSRPRGLAVFDYDGEFLHHLDLQFPSADSDPEPGSFVIYDDRILFLRPVPARITEFDLDGAVIRELSLLEEMDEETRNAPVLGTLAVINDLIVIPLPMMAQVARYTMDSKFHDLFGIAGGAPGELSFPFAAASDGRDGIAILDRHRHTVLHYDGAGEFIREVGGYGQSEGWLYYPSVLGTWSDGRCLVGQSYMNRVQSVSLFDSPGNEVVTPTSH